MISKLILRDSLIIVKIIYEALFFSTGFTLLYRPSLIALMIFGAVLLFNILFTRPHLAWGHIAVLTSLLFFGGLLLILDVIDFSFIDTALMNFVQRIDDPSNYSHLQKVNVFTRTAVSDFHSYLLTLGVSFSITFLLVYWFHIFGEKVIHDIKIKGKINKKLKAVQIKKDKLITHPVCQKIILKPKTSVTLILKSNDYIQPIDLKKAELESLFKCKVEGIDQETETHLLSITLKTSDLESITQD